MDDFEAELKTSFLEEAEQAIADVEHAFIELENDPSNRDVLDKIFRLAHNLKGSSKAVGFDEMGEFTHKMENMLLALKTNELAVTDQVISVLLLCSDHLSDWIELLKSDFDASKDSTELANSIEEILAGKAGAPASEPPAAVQAPPEPVSAPDTGAVAELIAPVNDDVLEPNFDLLEELGAVDELRALGREIPEPESEVLEEPQELEEPPQPEMMAEPMEEVDPVAAAFERAEMAEAEEKQREVEQIQKDTEKAIREKKNVDESIRISLSRLETLVNYVGEMSILQAVLTEHIGNDQPILNRTVIQMGKVMKDVQDLSMSLRMVPIKPAFLKMQRIVRDTSMALDKSVFMVTEGEDTEVDKTVIENIGDPLVHLVRNAVDHGIESPEVRTECGKSEKGNVALRSFHRGGRLVIEVEDDGGGLDTDMLRGKAVERGIIKPDADMTEQELRNLIFHPGFSTKDVTTDISGRGVGMDVVKTNIEAMSGEIEVESSPGVGTRFSISLPLTLAIIDSMVITLGEHKFVVPLNHIQESIRPDQGDIRFTTGLGEVLLLRGDSIPFYRLGNLLNVPSNTKADDEILNVLIVKVGHGTVAIAVDEIVGQYQVVIKQLGAEAQDFKGISATTILGDGKPALILELAELVGGMKAKKREVRRGLVA